MGGSQLATKVVLIIAASVLAVTLLGCGGGGATTTAKPSGPTTAPIVPTTVPGTTTAVTTTTTTTDPGCTSDQAQCTKCLQGKCLECAAGYKHETKIVPTGSCVADCEPTKAAIPPGGKPSSPLDLNGKSLPDMCIQKKQANFFGIGDWGGDRDGGHTWVNPGKYAERGGPVVGPDDWGQKFVARQMKGLAAKVDPEFILNAGDNFYPGGINKGCGPTSHDSNDPTGQFAGIYSGQYTGEGLDGKPWLSVLGNHDYGGRSYGQGWDEQIFHTWNSPIWKLPAQFWKQRIQFADFALDVYMMDSNFMDADPVGTEPNHNICQGGASCWGYDINSCLHKLNDAWSDSLDMLEAGLKNTTAEWSIVLTHFPGTGIMDQPRMKALAGKFDLVFTGHQHNQQPGVKNGVDYIISGGGGGVSSDSLPVLNGQDDAYGYVNFIINRTELTYEMHSWGGMGNDKADPIIRKTKTLKRRGQKGQEEAITYV